MTVRRPAQLGPRAVYEHLAFLVASADLCQREPAYYGTLRLLDAAGRFARSLVDEGNTDPSLVKLLDRIEEAKKIRKTDAAAYSEILHQLPGDVGAILRELSREEG
jgi:hypothetical protein